MKKHQQLITTTALGLLCLLLLINVALTRIELSGLQKEYEQTTETLQSQTQLIVELRQKAILRNFNSIDELTQWVRNWEIENKPTVMSILNHTFVIAGNDEVYSQYWDCDDISEAMQRDALRDGYLMSIYIQHDHAGNMAIAENAYWYIEPQTGVMTRIIGRD